MNLLNENLNQLIWLRKSRLKIWLIGSILVDCLYHIIRSLLMSLIEHFEFSHKIMNGCYFHLFFNFGQFNEIYLTFCLFPINCFQFLYEIFYKCNFQLWDPLLTTLTRDNWSQFVKNNLDFKPTFSLIKGMQKPTCWMRRWKVVLTKLQDYRQVRFAHPLPLFPYMNRKIRVKILYNLLILTIFIKLFIKLFSKSDN